jgi:hypothetical protein
MDTSESLIGLKVRYPRTGTEGTIEQVAEIDGQIFAAIDTTHLFYRIDQIITVEHLREKKEAIQESVEDVLEREKLRSAEEISKSVDTLDGVGGG